MREQALALAKAAVNELNEELNHKTLRKRHRSPYCTAGALTDFILEQLRAIHE